MEIATSTARGGEGGATVALSLRGSAGVLDVVVPRGCTARELASEYAAIAGLSEVPRLVSIRGAPIGAEVDLGAVPSGTVVVVIDPAARARPSVAGRARRAVRRSEDPALVWVRPSPAAVRAWCTVGAALALLAGWSAAHLPDSPERSAVAAVLGASALLGVLPWGRLSGPRFLTAPAYAAGASLTVIGVAPPERLPTVLGVTALVAAVTAAVARALHSGAEEGLRAWVLAGATGFALPSLAVLVGWGPAPVWATLLVLAVLVARFGPNLAVDVGDDDLLDVERLATSAWSARQRPRRRRGRLAVSRAAVVTVAERGARLLDAGAVVVAALSALSAPLLLASTDGVDAVGARVLVGAAGAALLLAARSYRHGGPRALLRLAGLACWSPLAVLLLLGAGDGTRAWAVVPAVLAPVLAVLVVMAAVALGRGWRSAWWSQRAEEAEALSGAVALAALVVAGGVFRYLWTTAS